MGPKVFGLLDQGFADAIWIGASHGLRVDAARRSWVRYLGILARRSKPTYRPHAARV